MEDGDKWEKGEQRQDVKPDVLGQPSAATVAQSRPAEPKPIIHKFNINPRF